MILFKVRTSSVIFLILCLCFIGADISVMHTSLFNPDALLPDGAYMQYIWVRELIASDLLWDEAAQNAIILMHAFRYFIYRPFLLIEEIGISLQYALLVLIGFPVLSHYFKSSFKFLLLFFPLIAAYFISYRAILCGFSIGYLTIYLLSERKYSFFIMAVILSMLSTAVAIQTLSIIIFYTIYRERKFPWSARHLAPIIVFIAILVMVMSSKLDGFASGAAGYNSSLDGNILSTILSRSTIYIGLINGSARAYAYVALALGVIFLLFKALLSKSTKASDYRLILLPLIPGFLVEGLGVMSMIVVLIWMFLGITLSKRNISISSPNLNQSPRSINSSMRLNSL